MRVIPCRDLACGFIAVKTGGLAAAAFPLRTAEIAAKLPKRLHPLFVFADYRKAANNDGFAALWIACGYDAVQVSAIGDYDKSESMFDPRPGVPLIS